MFIQLTELEIKNKIIFLRSDMNAPLNNGTVADDTRIKVSLKSINYIINNGGKVIIATHLGRPTTQQLSVAPIADALAQLLHCEIPISTLADAHNAINAHNVILLENARNNPGEYANSLDLGQQYAKLADIFCHDGFAVAHRAEASTDAVGYCANQVCIGIAFAEELTAVTTALVDAKHPIVAIIGGAKISTKLKLLTNLATKVDSLIVGGGILNTFLLASYKNIGCSLAESSLVVAAQEVIRLLRTRNKTMFLPRDVVVATSRHPTEIYREITLNQIAGNELILDIGPKFAQYIAHTISAAGTVIWNGPLGLAELPQFAVGTSVVANSIAASDCFSIAGGGDTIAALNNLQLYHKMSYVSTAGGALLEFLSGTELPAMKLLTARAYK